jgi:hypothetical protein
MSLWCDAVWWWWCVYPKPMRCARARACVREVTSVRSRVDRTRRNVRDVRVPNARVRVCGTAVEDASSRIETPRPATSSIERAVEPSRGWDDPTDPRWDRAVGRGLVRESRPVKRQTDRHPPRARSTRPAIARAPDRPSRSGRVGEGRDGSWWYHS